MHMILALLAVLCIPETTTRTMAEYPLGRGQAAYIPGTNGTAAVYVGGEAGTMRVTDPLSIAGYRETFVPRGDLSISCDEGINYDAATDSWWWNTDETNINYRIFVVAPTGTKIREVTYSVCGFGESGIPGAGGRSSVTVTNLNQVVIEGYRYGGTYGVSNIVLTAEYEGDPEHITDLTELHIRVIDSVGESELGGWRSQMLHAYDGNRGVDWADYPAKRHVKMNERPITFGSNSFHSVGMNLETNLAVMVRGHSALEFWHSTDATVAAITNTTHTKSGSDFIDTFYYDATRYTDSTDFQVLVAEGAGIRADVWAWVPPSQIAFSSGSFAITWPSNAQSRFYLVYYRNALVDAVKVIVRAPIVIEGPLYLRGEDSMLYRITVSGGTLSATAVD